MSVFKFHCPECLGSISADPEWEGQITGCPHCGESIKVMRPAPPRSVLASEPLSQASVLAASAGRTEVHTARRSASTPVERAWEDDYFHFCCPRCNKRVRVQGMMLLDDRVNCPDCDDGIQLSKAGELKPENPAPYRLPVSRLLFSYGGRVSRFHFWLLCIVPTVALPAVAAILLPPGGAIREMNPQARTLFMLLWFVPVGMPIMIKRLHDRGKSGHLAWLLLLVLLPGLASSEVYPALLLVGSLVQLIAPVFLMVTLGLFPGSNSVNLYGPPPSLIRYR